MFRQGQIEDIRNIMLLEDTPSSDASLSYCRSMRDRRRQKLPTQLPAPALSKLKSWMSERSSSLLLAEGNGVRTSCLDFAVDFLDTVLERGHPILWALPSMLEERDTQPSLTGILRSLISQALSLSSAATDDGVNPITAKHIKSARSLDQWLALFERCTLTFSHLFVVIDIGVVDAAVEHEEMETSSFTVADFIERMAELVKRRGDENILKIIVASWRFSTVTSLEATEVFEDLHISTDMGRKVERLMRQPKHRAMFRQRNRKFAERFKTIL